MNGATERSTDVRVLTDKVSSRIVVADGKPGGEAGTLETTGAVDGCAADKRGTLPHDLGEMTKAIKVAQVDVVLAVWARVVAELAVVHVIGDHHAYLVGRVACADVLAVAATVNSTRIKKLVSH